MSDTLFPKKRRVDDQADVGSVLSRRRRVDDQADVGRRTATKKPKWKLSNDLSSWASTFKVHADCLTALLKLIREYDFPNLPSDSRTLMNTPRDTAQLIRSVEPGQYIHIGIAEGIEFTLKQHQISDLEFIEIDYNTDGVQLTDSTDNVFWPIWCRLRVPRIGKPFLAGNYYSPAGQPKSFNSFTLDFVSELESLVNNGLTIGGKVVPIRAGRFLGDTPSRCDLLGVKHPTGYCGCGRCTATGVHIKNRIAFTDLDAPLRTDSSFKDRAQPEHHHFKSLVEENLGLHCISGSPLDGMHLVYACSVKRLLFWYNTDTVNFKLRLSSAQIDTVNSVLNIAIVAS